MAELISIGLYTLIIAYMGVGNLRTWAKQRLLALPNERSSHTEPTPTGGGAAIVCATIIGIVLFAWLNQQMVPSLWYYCCGAALVALISWYDDLQTISIHMRIGVHSASALLILIGIGPITGIELPLLGIVGLGVVGYAVSLIWIVGLTNAYNFMDGIDGLAGSQALIAGIGWAYLGLQMDQGLIMALGGLLALSSLGFLGYNWPPASIFMGDVGSAFLGFSFAVVTLLGAQSDPRLAVVGLFLIWPFLFDSLFTIVRRWSRGENIFQAHRSHLYQRLVIAGYSHRAVTLLYSVFTLAGVFTGLLWFYKVPGGQAVVAIGALLLPLTLWRGVRVLETQAGRSSYRAQQQGLAIDEQ